MRDMMCSACDKQISKMYAEYEIRGIHHYEKNSFCCSAAWPYIIPLDGWERL